MYVVSDSTNGDSERCERSEVGIIDSNANSQHRTICLFHATQPSHHPEIIAPSVSHFLHCADSSYTESEILLVELHSQTHSPRIILQVRWQVIHEGMC